MRAITAVSPSGDVAMLDLNCRCIRANLPVTPGLEDAGYEEATSAKMRGHAKHKEQVKVDMQSRTGMSREEFTVSEIPDHSDISDPFA